MEKNFRGQSFAALDVDVPLVEKVDTSRNDARLVFPENGHHVVFLFSGVGNLVLLIDPSTTFKPVSSPMRKAWQ